MMELASLFPKASEADWRKLVEGVLKGTDFDKRLVSRTADGIALQPLHPRRADALTIPTARGAAPWATHARLDDPDLERGNAMLLEELEGGADAISIFFDSGYAARGFGIPAPTGAVFNSALRGVHADLVSIRMETSPHHGRAAAMAFMEFAKARRLPGATLTVDFGFSPHIFVALAGKLGLSFTEAMAGAVETVKALEDYGFTGPFFRCDGRLFHDAGASDAQELASIIAQGVGLMRRLDELGIAPQRARALLGFTLSADVDQLATIAKIRALRRLWAQVEQACGLDPAPIRIHAETAWRMMSRTDPHVNILRNTIAAFGAGIGGADSLCVLPHSAALGLPDASARRLARNTSLILSAEANLHRVIDPAAGSGAIETLTDDLAKSAWSIFQNLEAQRAGAETGLAVALDNGFFAGEIAKVRKARAALIATRRMALTGVSEFPNLAEAPIEVLVPRALEIQDDAPFAAHRLAAPYEALREHAEALSGAGKPVRVFLANLGRIPDFNARAMFAKSAFEAGGIAALGNDGFAEDSGTDLVAMTDAFKASGASLACICSSDALYAEEAQDAAMALMASGAGAIFLAGRPGEAEVALRAAGVSGFLVAGMDLPAFLAPFLEGEA